MNETIDLSEYFTYSKYALFASFENNYRLLSSEGNLFTLMICFIDLKGDWPKSRYPLMH